MGILVFDFETSTHAPGEWAANPFYSGNFAVILGYSVDGGPVTQVWYDDEEDIRAHVAREFPKHDVWVGHNIGFDLHYLRVLMGDEWWNENEPPRIHDTMVVEHIVNGQDSEVSVSLDTVAPLYGGTTKVNPIADEYWNKGISTEFIPKEEIGPYLEGDVNNTWLVYAGQQPKIDQQSQRALVDTRMDFLLATIDMEYNGMYYEEPEGFRDRVQAARDLAHNAVLNHMKEKMPNMPIGDLSPGSPKQLSTILFGGTYVAKTKEPVVDDQGDVVLFKSGLKKGQVRHRNVETEYTTAGFGIEPEDDWKTKSGYSTGKDVLDVLAEGVAEEFIVSLREYRLYQKTLRTYLDGYKELVQEDRMIHPNLNHHIAVTGRLTCSKPNLQNVSSKKE